MFTAKYLKELMHAVPFKPFRISMTNGEKFEVSNHDSAFVMANHVEVGLDLNNQGIARRSVRCAYLHITSIEELQAA